jgi:hypothetical protein
MQRQCLVDPKAGTPQHRDQPAKTPTVQTVADDLHDCDDLRDGRWVGRIPQALVARRTTGMKAGNCRRRATTTGCINNGRCGHGALRWIRPESQIESAAVAPRASRAVRALPRGPQSEAAGGTARCRRRCSVAWNPTAGARWPALRRSGESGKRGDGAGRP